MSHRPMPPAPPALPLIPPSLARLARLTLKELRETLRDRRTIITLVLMPILVYPVLSLAFRQFLLSSFQQSGAIPWRFATTNQDEYQSLLIMMSRGEQLLKQREQSAAATARLEGGPILGADLGTSEPPLEKIEVETREDLEVALTRQEIDLGIRLLKRSPDAEKAEADSRFVFQLVFRPDSPTSRQAANFVQRRLRAVNEEYVRSRLTQLGDLRPLPTAWRLYPVATEKGHSYWLGTLVPLVLILMTITGAVYPAIDLTAGERERGTLEALMAAPVPRLSLLFAKYVAVLTVAMLTAVVNLTAMTVTVASSGLGPVLFGSGGLSPGSIVVVLALLVLFAAFFSAVLLSITSFARSFKEAQAYLIPLMLVSLAPGFMSVMPGLELGPVLSVTPLANIVLLARDVLEGDAPLFWGAVAVLATVLYGGLALTVAARMFGSDAILYGSESSWGDLFRPPGPPAHQLSVSGAVTGLAVVAPLYVIASGVLSQLHAIAASAQLMAAAAMTLLLFAVLPMALVRWQGVSLRSAFQLRVPSPLAAGGAIILGATLWPLAYDLIILCQDWRVATLSKEMLAEQGSGLEALLQRWRALPLPAIWAALAVAPAVCEELFFRGYMLSALRGRLTAAAAIGLTAVVFGLFHASVGGIIVVERIAASTLLGAVLGWVCWTSRSILPGMLLHAVSNGLMLSLAYYAPQLKERGWDAENQPYLPLPLVLATTLVAALALFLVWLGRARQEIAAAEPFQSDLPAPAGG